jgi:hypothetical protein
MSLAMASQKEEWKFIPGWESFYEVSNLGAIRSVDRIVYKNNGTKANYKGKVRSATNDQDGYLGVLLSAPGRKKVFMKVHHAVLLAFCGARPDGCECRHLDGNSKNNYLENLRWGTPGENNADRIWQATVAYGEKHGNCKLLDRDVEFIVSSDIKTKELACKYGVAKTTISRIRNGTGRRSIADLQRKTEVV